MARAPPRARHAGTRRMRPGLPSGPDAGAPSPGGAGGGEIVNDRGRTDPMGREGGDMRRSRVLVGLAIFALIAAGCSSKSSNAGTSGSANASTGGQPVTIKIWHNYGTEQNATALTNLVTAFEAANPNIKVDVVSQPADNYFALLKAAAISKTGPDLAVMWTGLFTLQYKSFLQNLKGKIPDADLARIDPAALKWTSDKFNAANGPYVIPLENQFYIGFYNKADFAKAGVASV